MRASAAAPEPVTARLPVHGFVLVGGQSSRMGRDKALLQMGGVTLTEIAVERLRLFCAAVSVVGNRKDLARFAPAVAERRLGAATENRPGIGLEHGPGAGPGGGVEAGLAAAKEPWALFTPVDVPFVPASLLRGWAAAVLGRAETGCAASYLRVGEDRQPAFALVHRDGLSAVTAALDAGERRLAALLAVAASAGDGEVWVPDAEAFSDRAGYREVAAWFRNLNTPEDLAGATDAVWS